MGSNEEEGTRLFSVVHTDRTRFSGQKLKKKKREAQPEHNKQFFSECAQILEQVAQRICGVFILGDTQSPTGDGPGQPAVADPD